MVKNRIGNKKERGKDKEKRKIEKYTWWKDRKAREWEKGRER